jgi:hypothetical protein
MNYLLGTAAAALIIAAAFAVMVERSRSAVQRVEEHFFARAGGTTDPSQHPFNEVGDTMLDTTCSVSVADPLNSNRVHFTRYQALQKSPYAVTSPATCVLTSDGWGLIDSECRPKLSSPTDPSWTNPLVEDPVVSSALTLRKDESLPGPNKCAVSVSPGLSRRQVDAIDKELYYAALSKTCNNDLESLVKQLESKQQVQAPVLGSGVQGSHATASPRMGLRYTVDGAPDHVKAILDAHQDLVDLLHRRACAHLRPDVEPVIQKVLEGFNDGDDCNAIQESIMSGFQSSAEEGATSMDRAERRVVVTKIAKLADAIAKSACTNGRLDRGRAADTLRNLFELFCPSDGQ